VCSGFHRESIVDVNSTVLVLPCKNFSFCIKVEATIPVLAA
jgi:hypothetical protein